MEDLIYYLKKVIILHFGKFNHPNFGQIHIYYLYAELKFKQVYKVTKWFEITKKKSLMKSFLIKQLIYGFIDAQSFYVVNF